MSGREADVVVGGLSGEGLSDRGPATIVAPGALTASGPALRAPAGPIHWAGTERSPRRAGCLDGAVRAAGQVLGAL